MNQAHLSLLAAQGDPGFFDVFKKIARGVTNVGRSLPGVGPLIGTAGDTFGFGPQQRRLPPMGQVPGLPGGGNVPILRIPGVRGALERALPGGATGLFAPGPGPSAGGIPRGFHVNKSSYFLKSGEFVPAGTRFVRNRTRNNANGKALRRAISRAKGFDSLVKRNRKALRSLARI